MKVFIKSPFGYCPLVWMFCETQTNACIRHIHERVLRTVYNDEISPLEDLLRGDKSETIYQRNIKILAAGLFKIISNMICKRNSVG